MTMHWETLPSGDFLERAQWRPLGDHRYSALRVRLLFVRSNGKVSRLGPVVEEHDVEPGDTITLRRKRERIVTRTESISEAIRVASRSRFLDSLSAKIAAELGAKGLGFSGKLQTETLTRSEYELTSEVEKTLTSTTSHSIEETEGREHELVLDGRAGGRRQAQLRRRYWPRHWDVYAHSYDYLELSYRRGWFWRQVRETMKRVDGQRLGWPLIALTFYEPQPDVVVRYEPVANELENPEAFEIRALTKSMPAASPPRPDSLEAAAQVAFPVSPAEKAVAADRERRRRAAAIGFASGPRRRGRVGSRKTDGKAPARSARRPARHRKTVKTKARRRGPARKRARQARGGP